ncbi:NAD(P)-dependent oxidoreductase [Heyndrickxia oleronia]|uniref:Oxidoreductase n=1 Tax=Heyndrickxia oleronia TaxID=38875 RepID=A0A8E2I460_9BACI|nr:NAD(P)-dependent oxidoreductase [Heyndrickxia oleronia]NYV67334.1 NAD(P)-dependent oxidoreductase [Bacillus sp. Gen3]OJH18100.1 oxidoreductase [Bacillus obstructivus]MCM3453072.1 NAD(P)-dependent oxidoreductase [Heyndrickxia oleronia]MEC1372819.1 NAD(P)-dependent oxidoreductase [Heyndrickxia oleronia]OOP65823.1 oxidoreductase [Heyndrickxia oleronia]
MKPMIGFIGTGIMGKSMISHLLHAGYDVWIYNRTKEKAMELIEQGAHWCNTPKEVAKHSNVIITMVGYPYDVEEVYFGSEGLLENAQKNTIFMDMTTSTPTLAKRIDQAAKEKGLYSLDAPVSGGDIGAKNGTLTIMVGGSQEVYDKVLPILSCFGKNIVYQGEAGAGQHTKMCNQIAIATNMIGVSEALIYAKRAGLDPEKVLQSISAGAAGSFSLTTYAPRMLANDYSPGFFIKHFIKDMGIALEEAEKMDLELPGLALAKKMYDQLVELGEENSGTQALIKYWE